MKGDISRSTFHPGKHYTGVRMQQGRVLLDSEWNEQVDIDAYLDRTVNVDVIGHSGVPRDGGGFAIIGVTGDLIISPGRMWVEGILCESDAGAFADATLDTATSVKVNPWPIDLRRYANGYWLQIDGVKNGNNTTVYRRIKSINAGTKIVTFTANVDLDTVTQVRPVWSYTTQPHDPTPPETTPDGNGHPALSINADYVVYLDVWSRHLTALEDESIREVALGGPDTTTRTQTIWQVRLDKTAQTCADILSPIPKSRLAAQTSTAPPPPNPCIVPSQAGYRGLANQLYRVEIHTPGALGTATFKWSRDNGAIAFAVEGPVTGEPLQLQLQSIGRDDRFGLAADDWVELIDDRFELQGLPGQFGRVKSTPSQNDRIIELEELPPGTDFNDPTKSIVDLTRNPRVRLWSRDPEAPPPPKGDTKIVAGAMKLESGIEVVFSGTDYRTGEYWQIPARTAINEETGDIEWPRFGNPAVSLPLPPRGITHHHAALADVTIATGKIEDCRPVFSPLTAPELFYLSGDGQEVMPDLVSKARVKLPYPLKVGVLNGGPIANADVEFKILDGDGLLANGQKTLVVTTGSSGVAETTWEVDATMPHQRCQALLLEANGYAPIPLPPIEFNASISVASQVAYDPAKCKELKDRGVKNVQDALDAFCDILDDPKLYFVGGDGQETTRKSDGSPAELPETIDVGVADGIRPVANHKTVRFTPSHNGTINGAAGPVEVDTAGNGLVSVKWALDSAGPESQTTLVQLLVNGNPTGLPVIFKAMFREVAQGGAGPCSIVISPGEDVLARIAEVAGEPDVEICFKTGVFKPNKPIIIDGKNSVKITGGGLGSHIIGASESVFGFGKCKSVIVRDLAITPGFTGAETDVDTVAFAECSDVIMDTLWVTAAQPPSGFKGSALAFRDTTRFSVEHCNLAAGVSRIGIRFDEAEEVYIAENRIGGTPIRFFLATKIRVVKAGDSRQPGNLIVDMGNQRVTATVPRELESELKQALSRVNHANIRTERAALQAFHTVIADLIHDPQARESFQRIDRLVRELADEGGRAFAAIAALGAKADTALSSGTLTVRDNVIHDVRSGVLLGELSSENDEGNDQVQRAVITGNTIEFNDDDQDGVAATAIFVPACDHLHIFGNHVEGEQSGTFGIRMRGELGLFAVLRDNELARCKTGIEGTLLGSPLENRTWWAIANNTNVINLPFEFARDKNFPPP